jgi:hypothetical protein
MSENPTTTAIIPFIGKNFRRRGRRTLFGITIQLSIEDKYFGLTIDMGLT